MPLTFADLDQTEQLKYANAIEVWARAVRDAQRWKAERMQDAIAANPPLSESTLAELSERLAAGYSARIPEMPTPDLVHAGANE